MIRQARRAAISLHKRVCIVLPVMSIAIVAAPSVAMCNTLPDVFDESTGYVTMETKGDASTEGNQSFFNARNWSDGRPPHGGTNYYVREGFAIGTPFSDGEVASRLETDLDCLTFKGDSLVVAGSLRHLNGTYEFTIRDLHMLPGSYISYSTFKSSLNGRAVMHGTEDSPNWIRLALSTYRGVQPFGMDVEGGPDGVLGVEFTSYSAWLKMTGDLSRFYGTMCVSVWSNSTYQVSPHPYGYYVATDAIGGTVQLEDPKACLYVASRNGLTVGGIRTTGSSRQESVGGLILMDGSGLSASAPRLTVTNSLSLASPLGVLIAGPSEGVASGKTVLDTGSFPEPDAAGDLALIRLTPECVANGGGGSLDESIVVSNALSRSWTQWRDDVDGGRTLWLVTCVSHTSQTDVKGRSSLVYPTKTEGGSDFYWDDGSCPADDASSGGKGYFSSVSMDMPGGGEIYDVPVRMLVQTALAQASTASAAGISCNDMVWLGAGLKAFSTGVADEPNRCHEDGNPYYFYKVRGNLRVPSGHDNTLLTYGRRIVCRIESEVSGGGNFVLTTIDKSSNFKNHCGYHEFTAFNTNFTGKIRATVATATASGTQTPSGYTTPNLTEHVRLFVADERNLGGRMRRYTWDALFLEQYSELFALGDVTLGDGWNRGVAIGNNGIMNVPDGATLTIMRPLNVNGNLFKVGAGTLALGGVLSFGGESMSEVPSSGANRLIVSGGYVKPLAAHSFDGLAMTFTNNAAIAIDGVTLDEELRVYGMVNEKESVSPVVLADDQEKLKVRIDFGDLQSPPNPAWQVGVLTLPHDKAVSVYRNMLIENPKPFKSWRGKLEVVPRSEGISTIVAVYGAVGTTIIFR